MKSNKLPEIGSCVELYSHFSKTWKLSHQPVSAHSFAAGSNHPFFLIGTHLRTHFALRDEGTEWRYPTPLALTKGLIEAILDKLTPNPPEALVDALKALPDSVLKALLEHMHAPGCDEHCIGCSCPKGDQDPSNVCQHCFYTKGP